jgi:bifunctional non-homologous end joining protein LigD
METMRPLEVDKAPLEVPRADRKGAHWIEPKLVAEIAFTEFTDDGILRHPSFIGLREDKPAKEVVREVPKHLKKREKGERPTAESLRHQDQHPDRVIFPEDG